MPRARPRAPLVILVALAVLLAGCASAAATMPGPTAPCNGSDPSGPGYYPGLEARVPRSWDGRPASSTRSGRYCSATGLGTLAGAGVHELRFGGATWVGADNETGVSMVAYEAPGLTVAKLADAFQGGALSARSTQGMSRKATQAHGRQGIRLDVVNGQQREAIVLWPAADGAAVNGVIGAGLTEAALATAIGAFGS